MGIIRILWLGSMSVNTLAGALRLCSGEIRLGFSDLFIAFLCGVCAWYSKELDELRDFKDMVHDMVAKRLAVLHEKESSD